MALQVWLPLNGNLENKGLANIKMTGTPVYSNGKIGKCVEFNATTTNIIYDSNVCPDLKYTDNFSFCLWVNNKRTSDDTAIQYVFTAGRADNTTYGYGIELTNPNFKIKFGSSSYSVTGTLNTWTHLAFTKQGTTIKIYKNGSLYSTKTFSGTLPEYTQYSGIGIGCFHYSNGNIYPSRCQVNDFRIYDHALSAKEVKEISKGLILHYKLDGNDIGITIPRNGGLIPDGVELYDYILSSGTLWIDTGTKANLYPFKLDIEFMSHTSSGEKDVWGNINSSLGDKYGFVSGVNGLTFFQWGGSVWSKTGATVNQWHVVTYEYPDANNRNMIADGTSYTVAISNNNIILSNSNIYLFSDGPRGSMKFNGKIKYAKIYVGNVLKHNMLPCTYLGEPGMWDTVENKFYRNQGTGLFTLGNKITLKEYEYLLSSGTQYIDTLYNPNNNTRVLTELMMTTNGDAQGMFGSYSGNNWTDRSYGLYYAGSAGNAYSNYVSDTVFPRSKIPYNIKHLIDKNKNLLYIDNALVLTHSTATFQASISMHIFKLNFSSLPRYANMRLYTFKIWDNNTLVRDFIPVSYNGTPGLWDKVEWKFYANAGSGSFTLGPEKTVQQDAPIFYDSSGYCNHGSITGTLTTNSDSPRYTASTVFNGGNNHVASPSIGKEGFKNSFTVSWWSKTSNMNGKMAWGSSGNGLNLYPSGSYFCWNTADGVANTIGTVAWATYNDGNWHHYVMTGDGTTGKLYIDGEHKGNAKTYKPLSYPIIYVSGWNTTSSYVWYGNISDFRIYCTTLSEDDIKELYNTSAFVNNNGVFAEYELYEDNLSDVKKRGLLETANFYENGAESGYALDTDKTRVASNYIISEEFIEI